MRVRERESKFYRERLCFYDSIVRSQIYSNNINKKKNFREKTCKKRFTESTAHRSHSKQSAGERSTGTESVDRNRQKNGRKLFFVLTTRTLIGSKFTAYLTHVAFWFFSAWKRTHQKKTQMIECTTFFLGLLASCAPFTVYRGRLIKSDWFSFLPGRRRPIRGRYEGTQGNCTYSYCIFYRYII